MEEKERKRKGDNPRGSKGERKQGWKRTHVEERIENR